LGAFRAIVPLLLLLLLVQLLLLRRRIRERKVFAYGVTMAIAGMALFNLGLTAGLVTLGEQAGVNVPWAFSPHWQTGAPALYPFALGIALTLLFAFMVGYGATVAEPALNAMGMTVENLTDGAFRKRMLLHAVAIGVGCGAALGVGRILFDLPLWALLLGGYTLALTLTVLSREELVNLAWDSAGVTTGPVTVPLLMALGLGIGHVVEAADSFGILAMCSVGPIVSVLATGLWVDIKTRDRLPEESRMSTGNELIVLTGVTLLTAVVQRGTADTVVRWPWRPAPRAPPCSMPTAAASAKSAWASWA
jgi:hypothetical protein